MPNETGDGKIGLVLAGGGARGAYEIGVLSHLLPALQEDAQNARILVGTSIGAVNATYLASRAGEWLPSRPDRGTKPRDDWRQGLTRVLGDAETLWKNLGFRDLFRGLERSGLPTLASLLGDLVNLADFRSLLDTAPLEQTLNERIDFTRLNAHVTNGSRNGLEAVAVATTSTATSRTTVFHKGGCPRARHDDKRGIDYISTEQLDARHVRASSAIPFLFRPVELAQPRGWYVDGFTRLNTPIKPALWLGAERIIIIGLNGTQSRPETSSPDAFAAAAQILQGLLADPLSHDVRELATRNQLPDGQPGGQAVPYIFIAPSYRETIGELAREVFHDHYAGFTRLLRARDIVVLGRLLNVDDSALNAELFSYLFFAPEFTDRLFDLGRRHAARWIAERHDHGLWRRGQPPQFKQD